MMTADGILDPFVDLDLTFIGWPHAAACLVAMGAFVGVMRARKGGARHKSWGRVFAIAYTAACITSLGIYQSNKFWFPHWLAVTGIGVLACGWLAVRYKPRGWRYIHLIAMLLSAYNLFGGAVNEAFLRIKPLRAVGGANPFASPLFGVTHSAVMLFFIVLIVVYTTMTAVRAPGRARKTAVEGSLS